MDEIIIVTEKIKPCPFCGGEKWHNGSLLYNGFRIQCSDCGCCIDNNWTRDEVDKGVTEWNNRKYKEKPDKVKPMDIDEDGRRRCGNCKEIYVMSPNEAFGLGLKYGDFYCSRCGTRVDWSDEE